MDTACGRAVRRQKARRVLRGVLLTGVMALLAAGCASTQMKGTPFYTGEYEVRRGPAEDRIALWPLLYYRDPALSVLWPFFEKTDDHLALRPLVSVYGLQEEKKITSVLWPLSQFDGQTGNNRIFPVFWGKDYLSVFPLYWHGGHPLGEEGGYSYLIPLWYFTRNRSGYSTHVLWPFIHFKDYAGTSGGRLWPAFGSYASDRGTYRFFLWPLGHQWSRRAGDVFGHTLFPVYGYEQDSGGKTFFSMPFSGGWSRNGDSWAFAPLLWHSADRERSCWLTPLYAQGGHRDGSERWSLLLPLYYYDRMGDKNVLATLLGGYRGASDDIGWLVVPALSWGSRGKDSGNIWALAGLAHCGWSPDGSSHHLFPLYYRSRDADGSLFISVPYSAGKKGDRRWQLVPPVFYRRYGPEGDKFLSLLYSAGAESASRTRWHTAVPFYYTSGGPDRRRVATLLGGYSKDGRGLDWIFYPLLAGGSKTENAGSVWALAPLIHWAWNRDSLQHHLIPLYYWDGDTRTFASPLYARWRDDKGNTRNLVAPLASMMTEGVGRKDLWLLGGLGRASWGEKAGPQHLAPLFYWNTRTATFVSLPWASWRSNSGGSNYLVPPALSWLSAEPNDKNLWLVGPVAHFSWGPQAGSQHVLPLYYYNRRTGTFVSLPAIRWLDEGRAHWFFPPALSVLSSDRTRTDLWMAGGLAHASWGEMGGLQYLFPLFAWDRRSGTFLSPAWAQWGSDSGGSTYFVPPALSWLSAEEKEKNLWLVGPLAHFSWGERGNGQHVFPLAYYGRQSGTFLSLLVSRWKDGGKTQWVVPPLLSAYSHDERRHSLTALLGLARNEWGGEDSINRGYLLPVYFYESGRFFLTPIFGWKKDDYVYPLTPLLGVRTGEDAGSWLFPLYSYRRNRRTDDVACWFFPWGGYDRTGDDVKSSLVPFYSYSRRGSVDRPPADSDVTFTTAYGTEMRLLLLSWYRNQIEVRPMFDSGRSSVKTGVSRTFVNENGFFPLWSYSRRAAPAESRLNVEGSLLWLLYDYLHHVRPASEPPEVRRDSPPLVAAAAPAGEPEAHDYTRARVLWHFWHYERRDGNVSMDMFPGITYDRRRDGFKKFTFLYRFFRYETGKDGTKLNLFFIPILW